MMRRLRLWWRIAVLRADIAGYEDDPGTIRALGLRGTRTEMLMLDKIAEARSQLYLCTRRHPTAVQGTKA